MKLPKDGERTRRKGNNKAIRHQRSRSSDHVTEMLKLCLEKICELQADLNKETVHDPEVAGYTACAIETMKFLSDHGINPDHPMYIGIADKLFRNKD